jgi:restriction system protein
MAVPRFEALMAPLLQSALDKETSYDDSRKFIIDKMKLTDADLAEMLPSGKQSTFANRYSWARLHLERAGLIATTKYAHIKTSDEGKKALFLSPTIDMKYLRENYPIYAKWRATTIESSDEDSDDQKKKPTTAASDQGGMTPEETIAATYQMLRRSVEGQVLERLYAVTPAQFEQIVLEVLTKLGFGGGQSQRAKVTGGPGDGGIDGIIDEDALGLDRIYVQAKRYAKDNSIGRPEIQKFAGVLAGEGVTKGVFITTSSFSKEARDFAKLPTHRIVLIDGARLTQLMVDHDLGVRTAQVYSIPKVDEDYFLDE